MRMSSDYKPTKCYGVDAPGTAEMGEASNFVGEKFGCLSLTLEQAFKDVDTHAGRRSRLQQDSKRESVLLVLLDGC
jgi:hypothetical protein